MTESKYPEKNEFLYCSTPVLKAYQGEKPRMVMTVEVHPEFKEKEAVAEAYKRVFDASETGQYAHHGVEIKYVDRSLDSFTISVPFKNTAQALAARDAMYEDTKNIIGAVDTPAQHISY